MECTLSLCACSSVKVTVYKITNKVNGKVYYGKAANVSDRWYKHCWDAAHGKGFPLHRAIRKYGAKAFEVEALQVHLSNESACLHERRLIFDVRKQAPGRHYNVADGGDGGHTMSPEQLDGQYAIAAKDYETFRRMFEQGATLRALSEYFRASDNAVKSCAERLGLSFPARRAASKQARLNRPKVDLRRTPEYSKLRSEIARRSNKSRALPEVAQREILRLYLHEDMAAKDVAVKLGVSKGAVRGLINRTYASLPETEKTAWKKRHGSMARQGSRNPNYRGVTP